MLRSEKQDLVTTLTARLKGSSIALCADYRGLTVAQVNNLRGELRSGGSRATVFKNTLIRRSVAEAMATSASHQVEAFQQSIIGPIMLITNEEDPIAPAKVLAKYAKEYECLEVRGGFFEGEFIDEAKINELSKMPGREELLSTLLRTILAPATNLVRLVNEPASQVVRVIAAHEKNLAA